MFVTSDAIKINDYTYKTVDVLCPFCHTKEIVRLNKNNCGITTCWTCKQVIVYREELIQFKKEEV